MQATGRTCHPRIPFHRTMTPTKLPIRRSIHIDSKDTCQLNLYRQNQRNNQKTCEQVHQLTQKNAHKIYEIVRDYFRNNSPVKDSSELVNQLFCDPNPDSWEFCHPQDKQDHTLFIEVKGNRQIIVSENTLPVITQRYRPLLPMPVMTLHVFRLLNMIQYAKCDLFHEDIIQSRNNLLKAFYNSEFSEYVEFQKHKQRIDIFAKKDNLEKKQI